LETRLAGVLVAALKEAFDRDSARLELERSQVDAERRRVEHALRAELRRQAAERALAHLRLIAMIAVGVWALSAALSVWLPGIRAVVPRTLLGLGWASSFAALGCAFAGWRSILTWSADSANENKEPLTATLAPWLLILALGLVGASLLVAL
jgi:protein-S-isoprenylcysteine O-methyltransferase Ste14